ncbi:MAG: hypothetical protein GX808_03870 [Syntrophomonadaceae bacterium]|nr:hypothetical protein [Syntrophomonadaceae bacterium]
MIEPIECEILISLDEFLTYLKDNVRSSCLVFVFPDQLPVAINYKDFSHVRDRSCFLSFKNDLRTWAKDTWEEGTIVILVP